MLKDYSIDVELERKGCVVNKQKKFYTRRRRR